MRRQRHGRHRARPELRAAYPPVEVTLWPREVRVSGTRKHMSPRPFDCLVQLMMNPGMVVTREALLAKVWRTHHLDDTSNVRNAISSVRTVLGLDGFIETTPDGWRIADNR